MEQPSPCGGHNRYTMLSVIQEHMEQVRGTHFSITARVADQLQITYEESAEWVAYITYRMKVAKLKRLLRPKRGTTVPT